MNLRPRQLVHLRVPRTVIVTETDMIETVAIQDEMTQQTSLLDHSEEQVQQGNGYTPVVQRNSPILFWHFREVIGSGSLSTTSPGHTIRYIKRFG